MKNLKTQIQYTLAYNLTKALQQVCSHRNILLPQDSGSLMCMRYTRFWVPYIAACCETGHIILFPPLAFTVHYLENKDTTESYTYFLAADIE